MLVLSSSTVNLAAGVDQTHVRCAVSVLCCLAGPV